MAYVKDSSFGLTTHEITFIYPVSCNFLYCDVIHNGGPEGNPEGILFYDQSNTKVTYKLRTVGAPFNAAVGVRFLVFGYTIS